MAKQLSIGQAAKHLGISRDTLRRWEKKGKITPLRSPSNRRYYSEEQLDDLLKKPKTEKNALVSASNTSVSNSLKLVAYSLLALLAAVVIAFIIQFYLF